MHRVVYLGTLSPGLESALVDAFRQGLRALDYVEGRNLVIDYRWAEGRYDRFPALVAEAVRLKPDVIVTASTPGILAAKEGTKTIPIVIASMGDPMGAGAVPSLAHPGGNITGSASMTPEIDGKRLELIKELVPGIDRVFAAIVAARVEAVVVGSDRALLGQRAQILEFVARRRLPLLSGYRELVEEGGLASYAPSYPAMFRRAATYVDRILKGAKPEDLPIEQPTRFELVINLKTARTLGLAISPALRLRADHIIE